MVPGDGGDEASSSVRTRRRRPEPSPTQRALGLLTRREHSRKELTRKLAVRGVEAGETAAVIETLAKAGWQDDARFAESLVRSRAAAGYGPGWIRAELKTHGLGAESISLAMGSLHEDWSDVARHLIQRRFGDLAPSDIARRRKALDLLVRRGFGMQDARQALHGLGDED